jgi:hypothetical protein
MKMTRRFCPQSDRKASRSRAVQRGAITALVAMVTITASLILTAGAAQADGSPPPIRTFPPAGMTAPPDETISNPAACSGWYQQGSYGGLWPTASTWWEYSCSYAWPVIGIGATNADWSGQYTWTDYFYWDGSKPVFYGEYFYDGYSDSMFTATYCNYWVDAASGWYGPLSCDY